MADPQPHVIQGKPVTFWRKQIDLALAVRRNLEPWWDANDKAYAPNQTMNPEQYGACINTNRDFTLVERKKADLFYKRPDVTLQPTPLLDGPISGPDGQPIMGPPNPQTGQQTPIPSSVALQAHEEIVNQLLDDEIHATRMAHQTLFDVLDLSGVGFTKMGYESVIVPVDREVQVGARPAPGSILGLGATTPIMETRKVPVPIYENCFWHHFGPKQAIVPHDFRSTEWDRSPFLAYQFILPLTTGNRQTYRLPPDFTGSKPDGKQYFDRGANQNEAGENVFTGVEGWYRSCLYREDRPHPEHVTRFVIVDGLDTYAIHEDSQDQTLDEMGGLTPDSLIGYPIHPLNMRTRTDSAWPPADMTVVRPLINELNRSREQNLEFRDAMTLKWMANSDTMPPDALSKVVRSTIGGIIVVPGEAFVGEGFIKELPQGTMPRENFAIADYIDQDISRSLAMDASQQATQSASSQTATAEQIQQANANARLDFEREIVLKWYCDGVTKYSTLVQRYLPVARAAKIVGPIRAQIWDVWRKTVDSRLAFTAMPDSALRVDQAVDRAASKELYSFLANDPYVQKGRGKLLEKLLRKFHIDPEGIVSPPDPPKPSPPKLAFSFKGEDLVGPQAPIVLGIAEQLGITIDPNWVTISQGMLQQDLLLAAQADATKANVADGNTKHGGMLAPQESLSKHASDKTGAMQGLGGSPVPFGAGGTVQ